MPRAAGGLSRYPDLQIPIELALRLLLLFVAVALTSLLAAFLGPLQTLRVLGRCLLLLVRWVFDPLVVSRRLLSTLLAHLVDLLQVLLAHQTCCETELRVLMSSRSVALVLLFLFLVSEHRSQDRAH